MMPFVTNLPGLKMNHSCCGFHLCRIATRAESQLITFLLESRGPFVLSSAECVMEKGARQAAAGQLGIAWQSERWALGREEGEGARGKSSSYRFIKKSKLPLITQLLTYFPAFSDGSADTLVSLQGTTWAPGDMGLSALNSSLLWNSAFKKFLSVRVTFWLP